LAAPLFNNVPEQSVSKYRSDTTALDEGIVSSSFEHEVNRGRNPANRDILRNKLENFIAALVNFHRNYAAPIVFASCLQQNPLYRGDNPSNQVRFYFYIL